MNNTKKTLFFCLLISLCCSTSEIYAKKRFVGGFVEFLFPLPVAIYNNVNSYKEWLIGQDEHYSNLLNGSSDMSYFEILQPGDIKTTFADVAGLDGAKEDVRDVISYLKNSDKYRTSAI